jgi:hypothetical protein
MILEGLFGVRLLSSEDRIVSRPSLARGAQQEYKAAKAHGDHANLGSSAVNHSSFQMNIEIRKNARGSIRFAGMICFLPQ